MAFRILLLAGLCTATVDADIYRWDTGQVIPGTAGITLEPGINLRSWNTESRNLRYGDFSGADLRSSNFSSNWLDNADLTGADLASVYLYSSTLTNANLNGPISRARICPTRR